MKKEEFLLVLRKELEKYKVNDIDSIIEYYDELIEDQLEGQKKRDEEKVIAKLGSIAEITKNIIIDQKVEIATQKPTLSNGVKAWIAALSIMSLPILIPLIIVIATFGFVAVILLASFVLVAVSLVFTFGAMIIALLFTLFTGNLAIESFFFAFGMALVLLGLSLLALKWLSQLTKQFTLWSIERLKEKIEQRKGGNNYE